MNIILLWAPSLHNIIKIHNTFMWEWHYYAAKYSNIPMLNVSNFFVEYRESHVTLLWI